MCEHRIKQYSCLQTYGKMKFLPLISMILVALSLIVESFGHPSGNPEEETSPQPEMIPDKSLDNLLKKLQDLLDSFKRHEALIEMGLDGVRRQLQLLSDTVPQEFPQEGNKKLQELMESVDRHEELMHKGLGDVREKSKALHDSVHQEPDLPEPVIIDVPVLPIEPILPHYAPVKIHLLALHESIDRQAMGLQEVKQNMQVLSKVLHDFLPLDDIHLPLPADYGKLPLIIDVGMEKKLEDYNRHGHYEHHPGKVRPFPVNPIWTIPPMTNL